MPTNRAAYMRAYYESHKEKIQAQQREAYKRRVAKRANPWLLDTRVDYKTPTKEDFQAVPKERELTYSQKYYAANRERIREQQQAKRKKDKINAKQREYYAANREKILEQQRENRHKKRREEKMAKTFWGRVKLKLEKIFG